MLRRIHSNADNLVHGRLPCLRFATTSFWHNSMPQGAVHTINPWRCCWVEHMQSKATAAAFLMIDTDWVPAFRRDDDVLLKQKTADLSGRRAGDAKSLRDRKAKIPRF
jgi:hypothetical protein